jgi:hypothetical protein
MKTSHKSDELKKKGGVHKSGTYDDMNKKLLSSMEIPAPSPSVIIWLAPKRVVIDQKLHIQ